MFFGRKQILLAILTLPVLGNSQSRELDELVLKRDEIKNKIISLKDSLDKVNSSIANFKANAFRYVLQESNEIYIYNCRPTTRLRKEAWSSGEIIKEFEEYTNVILLGFEGDYLKVNTPFGEGFVHRAYVTKGKRAEETNNSNTSAQNNLSSTNNTVTYPQSKKSTRKSTKTTYRRYYKGPRGGCYYINSNGNKTYVARSLCN